MLKVSLALATSLCLAVPAFAQSTVNLPEESQRAVVTQRIGLTDLTVSYHRPRKNGRALWGKLVPYGQVWRAGANENTTFATSDPVSIEGKTLPKGVYGLHMIPGEKEWTVIFSNVSTAWGSYTYAESEDALRVKVTPHAAEAHEALTFDFDNPQARETTLTLLWDKLAVPVRISVNVEEVTAASLRAQLRGSAQYTWQGWSDAAEYLLDHKLDLTEALADINHSLDNEERFENLMTKSRILSAMGKPDDARTARAKALETGKPEQLHGYGRELQQKGQKDQAMEIFQANIKKFPEHWLAHNETARIACAKGDFTGAVKEMKLALASAPADNKAAVEGLIKRLESKEDINK